MERRYVTHLRTMLERAEDDARMLMDALDWDGWTEKERGQLNESLGMKNLRIWDAYDALKLEEWS